MQIKGWTTVCIKVWTEGWKIVWIEGWTKGWKIVCTKGRTEGWKTVYTEGRLADCMDSERKNWIKMQEINNKVSPTGKQTSFLQKWNNLQENVIYIYKQNDLATNIKRNWWIYTNRTFGYWGALLSN